jgi:hypothetical protein
MKMKKSLFPALALAFLFTACSTEVDLEADWEDIPVVYAFLSTQDTAHYVRVQKVFLEPGGNAIEIAQITDSIYYQEVAVELTNLRTEETVVLQRVNGADEGYPKEEGAFANDPNVLYKVRASDIDLQGGDPVRLTINRNDETPPVTAETLILSPLDTTANPSPSIRIPRLRYTQNLTVTFIPSEEAQLFDVEFLIRYRESVNSDNLTDFVERELVWPIAKGISRDDSSPRESVVVRGQSFYEFLGLNIPPANGKIRIFDGMDLSITAGGQEMLELVELSNANIGITSAQNIPVYSNVEGGLGVFTSRYLLQRNGIQVTQEALDSLINGIYTRQLNFK